MRYKYLIYETSELIALEVEQDEPLPHLAVGHQLLLSSDEYQQTLGTALVVEHIRVRLTHLRRSFRSCEVHVYCRVEERPPPR